MGEMGVACYCMLTLGEIGVACYCVLTLGEIGVACYCVLILGEIGVACYCMLTLGGDRGGLLLYVNIGEIGVACYCVLLTLGEIGVACYCVLILGEIGVACYCMLILGEIGVACYCVIGVACSFWMVLYVYLPASKVIATQANMCIALILLIATLAGYILWFMKRSSDLRRDGMTDVGRITLYSSASAGQILTTQCLFKHKPFYKIKKYARHKLISK